MTETVFTGIYAFAAIFAVGTLALEMTGLLGEVEEETEEGGQGEAGKQSGGEGGRGPRTNAVTQQTSPAGGGGSTARRLFKLLWYARLTVYFSLGFGPVGLVAVLVGMEAWTSLLLSIPTGLAAGGLIVGVLRLQQREFDSSIRENDLSGRTAEVIVSIYPGELGKVRVYLEQLNRERYARGEEEGTVYEKGQRVTVTRVRDDCVYVRKTSESP